MDRRTFLRTLLGTLAFGPNLPALSATAKSFRFPKDFIWGAATAAYQIEGAWKTDAKGESIWDRFSHTPGKIKNGDTGDVACDDYHRYPEDIALCRSLNLNAYRFSISWPRIQPDGSGAINDKGLSHYDRVIDKILEHNLTPFLTLYHWDLPQSLQSKFGGWASADVGKHFAEYAAHCTKRYSDRVRFWTTFNEPWCIAHLGYEQGNHAPGIKNGTTARTVEHNLIAAHGLAAQAIRASAKQHPQVGIVLNAAMSEPYDPNDTRDVALAEAAWKRDCETYLDPLLKGDIPLDYLGVNYYFRNLYSATKKIGKVPGSEYTAFDWEVHPRSLYNLLTRISKEYERPIIYVTENGAAFHDTISGAPPHQSVHDPRRVAYLKSHIQQMALAMQDNANIKGYFAWSLMDNFEWAEGYSKRFGITYVDFKTQKRIVKDSGKWYAAHAKANRIELP